MNPRALGSEAGTRTDPPPRAPHLKPLPLPAWSCGGFCVSTRPIARGTYWPVRSVVTVCMSCLLVVDEGHNIGSAAPVR